MRPLVLTTCLLAACGGRPATPPAPSTTTAAPAPAGQPAAPPLEPGQAEAVFAGGCFWCVESAFDDLPGVIAAVSGYTGGDEPHPTYKDVSYGRTRHVEAVRVVYDPTRTDYATLLDVFWHNIDPTQADGQFCDRGQQYRSAVFVVDETQRALAEASRARAATVLGAPIDTRVLPAGTFWVAEDYHQDFHVKNPGRYTSYRVGCGRDLRLAELWGGSPPSLTRPAP